MKRQNNQWLNDYPRPMLKRKHFLSLNGEWLLNGHPIIVPFPPQADLSQYHHHIDDHLQYQRTFHVPDTWLEEHFHIVLHFEAVDQIAKVYCNHHELGQHEGGYLPFSFDITKYLHLGENKLIVEVIDALSHDYPYGKQKQKRGGMWYTPVSGIWQTVWLEALPPHPIENIKITPSLTGIHFQIKTTAPKYQISISLDHFFFQKSYTENEIDIDLSKETDHLHLWTPEHPYLYSMIIKTQTDCVETYFALRTLSIHDQCIYLNNQPIFLHGVLDQGYFHDGLYLPKTPQEYEQDILKMKELGFNTIRKHIKIESEHFYYACDKYGMLVIQDMVNNGRYHWFLDTALPNIGFKYRPDVFAGTKKQRSFFQSHMMETLDHLYNHPCIIAYTIFNEGWGQFQADHMYHICHKHDPTRFYDATSGWFHQRASDVDSQHVYFRHKILSTKTHRPILLSECGGYTRAIQGHLFQPKAHYGYGQTHSEEELTKRIIKLYQDMVLPSISHGLCGSIYTQLSDIEDEINGLYTYDRKICKVNKSQIQELSRQIIKAFHDYCHKDEKKVI